MQDNKNNNSNNRQNSKFTYISKNNQKFESLQINHCQNWKLIIV